MAKTPANDIVPKSGSDVEIDGLAGKGRPTPTRREREAARKRPLVVTDRAEARRNARASTATQRDRARIGLANGEERYLPVRDRGPQKRFVRDYVDSRFSLGELLIPMMVVVLALTLVPNPAFVEVGTLVIYAFFFVVILERIVASFVLRKAIAAKFGAGNVERVSWYATMRAVQLRIMRLPKPQVKRGQRPA